MRGHRPREIAGTLITPRVHGRGEAKLDAMLELAQAASAAAPLAEVLAGLCARVAQMLHVDVCSVYLRDGDELRLAATFGFPQDAVGRVSMRVGEGLTGFAVECLRPVSVAMATEDARNKAFEQLDERRFPSLCAVPLSDGGRAAGALVIQRKQPRAFSAPEVVLAASVTAPILFALERARRFAERDAAGTAPESARPRPSDVLLTGVAVAPGHALGVIALRRQSAAVAAGRGGDVADEKSRLGRALVLAADEITALEAWALKNAPLDRTTMLTLLAPSRFVLDDGRLRERLFEQIESGASAEAAMHRVTVEYTRALSGTGDEVLAERALEIEALCERVLKRLGGAAPERAAGSVLAAARLTVCDAVELAAGHGVGVALSGPAIASPGIAVASALGLPVVVGLGELFRWVAGGDRALLDGEAGTLLVNPSRVDVAAHRRRRKDQEP